jgi:hypothetical protein
LAVTSSAHMVVQSFQGKRCFGPTFH